ncbi:alkaline phosphatase D family protein [bacterium]|nr:alkaline phosphatase D family protein [bacterium]
MDTISRRKFLELAASFGATLAWGSTFASESKISWRERRDVYPQGVASGDPHPDSVILWTRRPPGQWGEAKKLLLEVAEDFDFRKVIATTTARVSAETDWTCRVLAAGLQPRRVYWYRFTDESGFGSRIGRTVTAPSEEDEKQIAFAFVSCQNVQEGACNAYRRMIWEDEKRSAQDQLGFVLHLGDYVYEVVIYPEDGSQRYDRRLRDIVRYPGGKKFRDMHYPMTLEDYRLLYRAYLADPDLQDARARWPFVCVWDNHEFSWKGRQSIQNVDAPRPAQKVKVAANQAWFEYQPGRVLQPGGFDPNRFHAPDVANAPIDKFDEYGLGQEPNNLAAIRSLQIFRTLRYGRNVDLIITDNHSFRSESVLDMEQAGKFTVEKIPFFFPQNALEIMDAGRAYNDGKLPATIRFGGEEVVNPFKDQPPKTVLGIDQKKWFLNQLKNSKAPWKLWGNSFASLDPRLDLQNASDEIKELWPVDDYGVMAMEWGGYPYERAEIFDFIQREKIPGFVSIAGDRHSFFAGLLSAALPPKPFVPVGAEFITGSVSAPGLVEALEHNLPKDDPLRAVFLADPSSGSRPKPAINLSLMHGIRSAFNFQKTGNLEQALSQRNAEVAPHLWFADMGGHGYAVVFAGSSELKVEFVCIPRPLERAERPDGGPLQYRVAHHLKLWKHGETPRLQQTIVEGDVPPGASRTERRL